MAASIPALNRIEQIRHYGVDCGDAIEFEAGSWLPGGEHVKKIIVKNVSKRSLKFKYELPTTKYFSMDFPILITLSPGMHTTLDVVFRPVKLEEYDDSVIFHMHIIEAGVTATSGRFRLPVRARIAGMSIEIPPGIDFGFCPTAETTSQQFLLRNTGQIDAFFDWAIPGAGEHGHLFAVHPSSGRINVGQSIQLTASFSPTSASVYVTTTECTARACEGESDLKTCKTMKISGISKFTHIAASETELNFGEIFVGAPNTTRSPTEKEFVLRNRSLVRASFQVKRVESDCDPVYFFTPTSGIVEPESSITISVKYTPLSTGTFTCDHYEIITPGGNTEQITCKGRAVGPIVSLWKKNTESNFVRADSINFHDVPVGQSTSRVLTLRNTSVLDVYFHFDCQECGVFEFDKVNGRIAPALDMNVVITFKPTKAGNFYRRFFLLLQNQTTLYVDVLGTAYCEQIRPSPFQKGHVAAYRNRIAAGLGLLSPDQLDSYWQEHGDALFLQGALRQTQTSLVNENGAELEAEIGNVTLPSMTQLLTRSGEAALSQVEICHEYFVRTDDASNPILVHGSHLEFGNCNLMQFPSKKTLLVTNNTHGKVTCTWRVASATNRNKQHDSSNDFEVFPDTLDISAGATAEFRVAFQPSQHNTYYFAELEGFVSFKSNRTFRLVNVETFTPPWCVVAKVSGNTFASPTDQFLPKVHFRLASQKRKVYFPPCYHGDHVFQTILIDNLSDTPAYFSFMDDPTETFTCNPRRGYIAAMSFHLVQIRFAPKVIKTHIHALHCIVNNASGLPEVIELVGICALPQLTFDIVGDSTEGTLVDPRVFIKPTAVGLHSSRSFKIINASRVPFVYKWDIPSKYQDVFNVTPKLGRLNGRESAFITTEFTPTEVREYMTRFSVSVKSISLAYHQRLIQTKIPVLQESSLRIQTQGTLGAVLFEPTMMRFDTILVHTSAKRQLLIINTADCDLHYTLIQSVTGKLLTPTLESIDADNTTAQLVFSENQGCIPARSRKQIGVTFLPRVAGTFTFEVRCETSDQFRYTSNHVQTCIMHAEASFPTVVIEDIRVPEMPTSLAWHQFMCKEINEYLAAPLSLEEAHTTNGEIVSPEDDAITPHNQGAPIKHVAIPFSPAPLGSRSQQVFIKLKNPGSLVVQFALRYPREGNVEIEHWAETSAPSSEDVKLNAIIDSKIFGISPRQATLLPNQSITLTLSYTYTSAAYGGLHDLPLLLQVDKGRKMVLELQGRTLEANSPKIFLPQRVFELSPVMIGEYRRDLYTVDKNDENISSTRGRRPPTQQLEVFNLGDSAFRLEVSTSAFTKHNSENYGFPLLHCVSASDIVPARSSHFLDIEFSPIEARTIEANLVLKAHGLMGQPYKEVVMITIIARGYHPFRTTLSQLRQELALSQQPLRQCMDVPGQNVRFICDHIDFGHLPTYAPHTTQLLVLENHTRGCPIRFEWDRAHPLITEGVVRFTPDKGEVTPGTQVLIQVTLITGKDTRVVHHDIACSIIPLTGLASSPTKQPSSPEPKYDIEQKPRRTSVITRSTVAQEAVVSNDGSGSPSLRKNGSSHDTGDPRIIRMSKASTTSLPSVPITIISSPESIITSYPLYTRVFAHIIPRDLFEKVYSRPEIQKLPPSTISLGTRVETSSMTRKTHQQKVSAQELIMDVMETLFGDVLNSDVIQAALEYQPKPARGDIKLIQPACFMVRQRDDCEAIVTNVMENTVFNILQELFYEDIEKELLCVPRKSVLKSAKVG